MNEEMRSFFSQLIRSSQDETSRDVRDKISRSEANVAAHVARDIVASQERVTSHMEEKLSATQLQMKKVSTL